MERKGSRETGDRPSRRTRVDDPALVEKILRLVGLGVRGRGAVVGMERVREGAKGGKIALALIAGDASHNTLDKLVPLLEARRINFIELPSAARLGAAVGREQTAAVGIVDRPLAKGIRELVQPRRSVPPQEGV